MAIRRRQVEIVRLLLDRGVSLSLEDDYGFTAMTHAVILSQPNDESSADDRCDPRPLRMLMEAGGMLGLQEAVHLRDLALARLRLDEGADPNIGEGRYDGSLLMIAARMGDLEIVNLLLDYGANAEATDDRGSTSPIEASMRGHIAVVKSLLDRGLMLAIGRGDRRSRWRQPTTIRPSWIYCSREERPGASSMPLR